MVLLPAERIGWAVFSYALHPGLMVEGASPALAQIPLWTRVGAEESSWREGYGVEVELLSALADFRDAEGLARGTDLQGCLGQSELAPFPTKAAEGWRFLSEIAEQWKVSRLPTPVNRPATFAGESKP
jgi:hypothetical protein